MPIEDILRKIEEDAEIRKKSIIEEAHLEAERRVENAEREVRKRMQLLREEAKSKIELESQRYLAEARLQGKTLLSEAKYRLLEELRKALKKAFFEKIEEVYSQWCKKLLLENVQEGDEIFMAPEEANRLGRDFVEALSTEKSLKLSFGGTTEKVERGFLIRRGGCFVNLSFESIIEDFLRRNEQLVAQLLAQGVAQ
ncbi:MAG: V/A-type H+/Na+-transporting ATPase subunit [Candidatus Atribacteria bacterium]|jgi:vacuolar-type H+-ATPase subunit E/Vma4|uniref:V-type ATP synthase subunit E n=1 Tax=Thermatribacter velox TaxID=3039681 RepID=A0ABZ2YFZ6_9BACT|nr:V/A-type H+/Na+-transporting ATPase subunit [Candidatus Atribacteria bacterium]MDI3530252.1 V/A-type H+/Na+-transporting ATPase subunit [Candidatus Atribacteria bacterium]